MEISSIHTQIWVHIHVNKTDFHIKDFVSRTRFETDAKISSKIAYFKQLHRERWEGMRSLARKLVRTAQKTYFAMAVLVRFAKTID